MTPVSHGKPCAGNPHARFEEGASASEKRGGRLYSTLTGLPGLGKCQEPVDLVKKLKPKEFLIIGNMNAITYKEVFPLIMKNNVWLGATGFVTDMVFAVPKGAFVRPADKAKAARLGYVGDYTRLGNSCWFTNLDHGRRHQPLRLMTMAENIKFSKHKEVRGIGYKNYDNYDAIEVPFTDAIPGDYDGVMGVPISFLDKYCPEQFELIGITDRGNVYGIKTREYTEEDTLNANDLNRRGAILVDGVLKSTYARILIRARRAK